MKESKIILLILCFILILQIIKCQGNTNTQNGTGSSTNQNPNYFDLLESIDSLIKPSNAFTAVFLVYMFLIIIGAILILIFVKPLIEN